MTANKGCGQVILFGKLSQCGRSLAPRPDRALPVQHDASKSYESIGPTQVVGHQCLLRNRSWARAST